MRVVGDEITLRLTSDQSEGAIDTTERLLEPLVEQWAILLQTQKRDGSSVGTPVNVAVEGDRAYFGTPANTAKVKRLRNFPEVEITPCTVRGKPTGPSLNARARPLEGEAAEAAARLLKRKYRVVYGLLVPLELRIKRTSGVYYELTELRASSGRPPFVSSKPSHQPTPRARPLSRRKGRRADRTGHQGP